MAAECIGDNDFRLSKISGKRIFPSRFSQSVQWKRAPSDGVLTCPRARQTMAPFIKSFHSPVPSRLNEPGLPHSPSYVVVSHRSYHRYYSNFILITATCLTFQVASVMFRHLSNQNVSYFSPRRHPPTLPINSRCVTAPPLPP